METFNNSQQICFIRARTSWPNLRGPEEAHHRPGGRGGRRVGGDRGDNGGGGDGVGEIRDSEDYIRQRLGLGDLMWSERNVERRNSLLVLTWREERVGCVGRLEEMERSLYWLYRDIDIVTKYIFQTSGTHSYLLRESDWVHCTHTNSQQFRYSRECPQPSSSWRWWPGPRRVSGVQCPGCWQGRGSPWSWWPGPGRSWSPSARR